MDSDGSDLKVLRMGFVAQWLQQKFEVSRKGQGANVKAMEGLRGYAVFLVFIVHYVSLFSPFAQSDDPLVALGVALQVVGNTGVDLFFVLSGYLIYGALIDRRPSYGAYFRRRIRRIYPVFLAVFALYFVLSFVFPGERKIPDGIGDAVVYLLQNLLLLPGLFPIEPMITVAWSLSYELFYYLMIPLVIEVFRLRSCRPAQQLIFFMLIAVLLVVFCAALGGPIRMAMFFPVF
jgi:peptidoglycan/LPS O-acetylase OafA/YrhL